MVGPGCQRGWAEPVQTLSLGHGGVRSEGLAPASAAAWGRKRGGRRRRLLRGESVSPSRASSVGSLVQARSSGAESPMPLWTAPQGARSGSVPRATVRRDAAIGELSMEFELRRSHASQVPALWAAGGRGDRAAAHPPTAGRRHRLLAWVWRGPDRARSSFEMTARHSRETPRRPASGAAARALKPAVSDSGPAWWRVRVDSFPSSPHWTGEGHRKVWARL